MADWKDGLADRQSLYKIAHQAIVAVVHKQPAFAELFNSHLLARNSRVEGGRVGNDPLGVAIETRGTLSMRGAPCAILIMAL
jgi:hypothetical protein